MYGNARDRRVLMLKLMLLLIFDQFFPQGFVGTQAYMAPEVFTRNMHEGHGRAADIWFVHFLHSFDSFASGYVVLWNTHE